MTYTPKLPLQPHQVEAVKRAYGKPAFAYLLDMGTGKSATVLAEFGAMEAEGTCHDLLVVAPKGSYLNWCEDKNKEQISEFKKHMSDDLFKRLAFGAWKSGTKATTQKLMKALLACKNRPRALLMNIEVLSTSEEARQWCAAFLNTPGRRSMVVVDESTTIKGNSNRAEELLKLGSMADVRRILTGLVAPKSPLDVYRQFAFLDWKILGHKSWFSFRARYAVLQKMKMGGRTFFVENGYQNLEELQEKIAPYSYRVLKDDVLDIPPKVYELRHVPLTAEQERIYRELKEYATARIAKHDHVTATIVIVQIIRLHQLICGFATDDEQHIIHEVPSNRIDALITLLREHKGKAVIWSPYRHSIDKIVGCIGSEFGPGAVAAFHGGSSATRSEDERRFLTDPECRFMVATQSAGGRGNTWIVADLVVYFANTYDLEMRAQSEDRCHRHGQTKSVRYVDLLSNGTVDELILKSLRNKINLATQITGENFREWLI